LFYFFFLKNENLKSTLKVYYILKLIIIIFFNKTSRSNLG
jgi:hypothetical protein